MGPDIAVVRQNLDLLVDNGQPAPGIPENWEGKWGGTLGNKLLVWRSGVGVTANGAIVYVAGDGLGAASLADLMVRAGVARGMELDINEDWVTCFVYSHPDPAQPTTAVGERVIGTNKRNTDRYFHSGDKDFIALFRRP